MRKIYKYPLEIVDEQIVNVPAGAILLTVQVVNNEICLYAIVDESQPLKQRLINIYGTGQPIDDEIYLKSRYIDTVIHGQYVWHIFENIG